MKDKSIKATSRYKKQIDRKEKAENKIKDEIGKAKASKSGTTTTAQQSKIARLKERAKRKDAKAGKIADKETKRTGPKEVVVVAKRKEPKSRLTRTTNSTKFGGKLMKEDI
jgi:hypothetical protein